MNSERKLKKIKDEILAKAEHLNTFNLASESMRSYEDLLNSTCDLYSELMFASICKTKGMDVKLNEVNDFLIDNQIAEVKSIHDDYNRAHFDLNDDLLTKSITNSYRIEDLQDEISTQLLQPKWHDHLSKAISKQKGKIVFVNATQSPNLGRISVFIEEHNLKRDIKKILNSAMEFMDKQDVLPVLVTMEAIHNLHVVSFMLFLLPIRRLNGCSQIDVNRYNKNFLRQNIFL
jgi:hypothetical protein